MALSHAVMILGWQEHLLEAEMPPRWAWCLDEELNRHFERVKSDRDSGRDRDYDDADGPMMQNEYARNRGRHAR